MSTTWNQTIRPSTTRTVTKPPVARAGLNTRHPSIRKIIGESAWLRLPKEVRARFADDVMSAQYQGCFEIVHASWFGKSLAFLCRLIGTPIVPYTGANCPATVHVFTNGRGGMVWKRIYQFSARRTCVVSSTKQLDANEKLVEALSLGLRMPLSVFEQNGVLHFVSVGYFFAWLGMRISIPLWLSPGKTHVQHVNEDNDWFRFTMTTTHPWFGEVYFQTGRFRAVSEAL